MGLAQGSCAQKEFQIYVTCAVDLLLAYLNPIYYIYVELMQFELSGDDDICSNYMSFRIIGS